MAEKFNPKKTLVKNLSRGPRTVQEAIGPEAGQVRTVTLLPGEEREVALVDENDTVLVGMEEAGELRIGPEKKTAKRGSEDDPEVLKAQIAELQQKLADANKELDEERFRNNPRQAEDRQLAMRAGATPGLADPLPHGTDTKGGEEAEQAKANLSDAEQADDEDGEEDGGEASSGRTRRRTTRRTR